MPGGHARLLIMFNPRAEAGAVSKGRHSINFKGMDFKSQTTLG